MNDQTKGLKALGSGETNYEYEGANADLLEKFVSPFWAAPREGDDDNDEHHIVRNPVGAAGSVHIEIPEFTSLCPLTGQPDFATIIIDYLPREWCVESKSLKLYIGSFRNSGEFHESCTCRIINDLVALLDPYKIQVQGRFTPRGGIPFWPDAQWIHPDVHTGGQPAPKSQILTPGRNILKA